MLRHVPPDNEKGKPPMKMTKLALAIALAVPATAFSAEYL
jgi:hypothetical protein